MRTVRYAGFWVRLAALLIDSVIMILMLVALFSVVGLFAQVFGNTTLSIIFLAFISLFIAFGYMPYFLATKGATPGKDIMGLVVVDSGNRYPIPWSRALLREIVGRQIVNSFTLDLGNLLIIFDSKKQALHDKIGGTYVVHKDSLNPNVIEHQEDYP